MELTARKIVFSGRVQGVGFRFTALNIANRCQLTGYVRNIPEGNVEMLAQGSAEMIDECVRDIQDSFVGSVSHIDIEPATPDPKITDFRITF
ncbi:MAG: acylphosphatase [Planctomycetes bacterium]|nr:acylphosphatase [Planctomycetota bacterium]